MKTIKELKIGDKLVKINSYNILNVYASGNIESLMPISKYEIIDITEHYGFIDMVLISGNKFIHQNKIYIRNIDKNNIWAKDPTQSNSIFVPIENSKYSQELFNFGFLAGETITKQKIRTVLGV